MILISGINVFFCRLWHAFYVNATKFKEAQTTLPVWRNTASNCIGRLYIMQACKLQRDSDADDQTAVVNSFNFLSVGGK